MATARAPLNLYHPNQHENHVGVYRGTELRSVATQTLERVNFQSRIRLPLSVTTGPWRGGGKALHQCLAWKVNSM